LLSPFHIDNKDLLIGTSIGVAIYPSDGNDADTLLRNSDTALYKAKEDGRNTFTFYSEDLYSKVKRRMAIEEGLYKALDTQELYVHYQPQANCIDGSIIGMEALIRWQSKSLGMVSPVEFIPIAETLGIVKDLDSFVLHTAIKDTQKINEALNIKLNISVNVSAKQLMSIDFPDQVNQELLQNDFEANQLTIELTETALLNDFDYGIEQLKKVRDIGVGVAIDDFGTGYSSLTYLHKLPATEIKIDRSFIRDILVDPHDAILTKSIIQMGQGLSLHVVAEGVESQGHLDKLKEYRCDYIQGYFLSKPVSIEKLEQLINSISR